MNIQEFFQASVNTLQKYVMLHYDLETWVTDWTGISDVRKYYKTCEGTLSNPFFYFDWTSAAYRKMAQNWTLYKCPKCGLVASETVCWMCECDMVALAEDETREYFQDNKYDIYEQELADSLREDGWKSFCAGTHPQTDPVRDEIVACLKAIASDADPEDRLVHLMWSLRIQHANGNVLMSYSGLDWAIVDAVRTHGIQEYFGRDEVEKFLRGEYEITVEGQWQKSL